MSLLASCIALMALGCFVSQAMITAAFLVATLHLVHRWFTGEPFPRLPGLEAPLLAYAASFLASAAAGVDPHTSFRHITELKRLLIPFLVVAALRRSGDVRLLCAAIGVGAAATTARAYYQMICGATVIVHHQTVTYPPGFQWATIGLASTPNDLAGVLLLAFGLFAAPACYARLRTFPRAGAVLAAAVAAAGIVRSLCRSAAAAAAGGLLASGLVTRPPWTALVMVALIGTFQLLPDLVQQRYRSALDSELYSNRFRVEMAHAALAMAREHPVLGVGRRNFEPVYETMRRPGTERSGHAHNNYLNLLAEMGVVGLAAFLWLQVALFLHLFRSVRRDRSPPLIGACAALAGFAGMGLFHFNWGDAGPVTLMWIVVGLAYARPDQGASIQTV